MEKIGFMPGERRKKENLDRRNFHEKIEKLPSDKAFFVLLGKDCIPMNARPLCINTTDEDAMEILKLHKHHHSGDSVHKFTNTKELYVNQIF